MIRIRSLLGSGATLALALFASCGGGGGSASGGGTTVEQITLLRDPYGAPHVFAATDVGAYFGAGYAAAQDRLFEMFWSRLLYQGRVAEFFGPGTVTNPQGQPSDKNVIHDVHARLIGWAREAARVAAALDPATLALLQAYADGVNEFLAHPTGPLHPFFAQYGLPLEPWTPTDCIGVWMRLARHFGSDALDEGDALHKWQAIQQIPGLTFDQQVELLLGPRVCDDTAAVVDPLDVPPSEQQAMQDYATQHGLTVGDGCQPAGAGPHFSQAWVVGGARTTTGRAVLVGDPRLQVFVPSLLYEWSMRGASFEVRGFGVPGSPNLLGGSSSALAWSPTALGLDQADLFLLVTDPSGHPGQYFLDGQWVPYSISEPETIHVRGASDVGILYRETYWGPVVTSIALAPHPGEEYALRRVPFDDVTRDPSQGFAQLYRAGDVHEAFAALDAWNWPAVNLVFGDAAGHIGYSVVGSTPIRSPALVLPGVIAQDGSSTASDWIDFLPQVLKPHAFDPQAGFFVSANHRPVGSWYPIPLRFGTGSAGDTNDSRRIRELLAGPATLTPDDVRSVHHDVVNPSRRDLVELALFVRDAQAPGSLSQNALRALSELEPWWQQGARMDATQRGVALAWTLDTTFRPDVVGPGLIARYGGGENGLVLLTKTKIADVRASPPVPLDALEVAFLDDVLATAWIEMQTVGPPSSWLAWYQTSVLQFDSPEWTSLEGLLTLDPGATIHVGPLRTVDPHTPLSAISQSYTQVCEVGAGDSCVSAAPPGAGEQGPHAMDQLSLWKDEQFKPSPITQAGVNAMGPPTTIVVSYAHP